MTAMNHRASLKLDFRGYWHAGSGRSSGHHLDAVCERDGSDLPYFPGRQLKGILRHAVRRAEAWGWLAALSLADGPVTSHEELLFGSGSQMEGRHATFPGLIQVGDAGLSTAEHEWLRQPEQAGYRACLFTELFSTAIDENGTARKYSLRGLEVCLPTHLESLLELHLTALDPALRQQQQDALKLPDPWMALKKALPLVDALGAHRSRGLGEAEVTLAVMNKGA